MLALPALAANRATPPHVSVPGIVAPAAPQISAPTLPSLPALTPAINPAPAVAPAQAPVAAAAQLGALGEGVQPSAGKSEAAEPAKALDSAFDGLKSHGCAHCFHADDDHSEDFPSDAQGNPVVVPGHLEPLLPSRMDPKTWSPEVTLHLHSIYSDGTMTPEALVDLAASKGVRSFALSDHDTTAGIMRAWKRAKELGLDFHPSIEATARGGAHIGAVDVDVTNPRLVALLERVRAARLQKAVDIVANLNALPALRDKGITITIEEVRALSMHDEGGTIELPHVARALLAHGLISNVDEAFDTLLKDDVLKHTAPPDPTVEEWLSVIKAAGGKAFLNHPYTVRGQDDAEKDRVAHAMLKKGFDGVEVYRPIKATSPEGKRRADERAAKYLTWIDELGLLAGNGADFHGTDTHLDALVVWMPKVLAKQLEEGLKDAQARAIAALERLDGQAAAPKKTPPTPMAGAALLGLASSQGPHDLSWLIFIPPALLLLFAIVSSAPWFKEMTREWPRVSDFVLFALAVSFAASCYLILLAKVTQ